MGRIIALHGESYDELPGFGLGFEAYVAKTIAEHVLGNEARGRVRLAERDGRRVGCTAVALRPERAGQLRWVLVEQAARGGGLGRRLVETAMRYSTDLGCDRLYLETTDGLPESQALYEKPGLKESIQACPGMYLDHSPE